MEDDLKKNFLEAYDLHAEALFRHAFFRVFSNTRAEELVQDAFMKTWEYLERGERVLQIRPFLYRVLNNLIIDDVRKAKEMSLEAILEEAPQFEPVSNEHHETERKILFKEVISKFTVLSDEERQILTLRYVDDLDPKDIALILKVSVNHASVKLNRAMNVLKSKFPL